MSLSSQNVRRIVLTGAECTGKSTLAKALAAELGEPWSGEYVRTHVEQLDRALEARDLEPIARAQLRYEDEAYAKASKYVVHDTNILSSILYAKHYFDVSIPWVDETFAKREYFRYFLCLPDIPWIADPGQRESPQERLELHGVFVSTLERHNIAYTLLEGTLENRLKRVLAECC